MVKFDKFIYVSNISKDNKHNYVEGRRNLEKRNRILKEIERYMKTHDLLFKYEYLEFVIENEKNSKNKINKNNKNNRIEFIESIARDREWLHSNEHLKIVR
jgi:hypothetical protein